MFLEATQNRALKQRIMNKLFRIIKFDEASVKKVAESPNKAHTHDFEELIVGIEGEMEHFIDFKSINTPAPFVSYVTKGKVHRVVPKTVEGKCDMWVIQFKSEFIPETTFQLYSFYHDQADIKLKGGACFQRLDTLCQMMYDETQLTPPNYAIIRQLLSALFSMIEAEKKKENQANETFRSTQHISFKNFLAILEENFRRPLGVEFYAEKLFMSSRNLNIICQNILEQSVSEIIETRKLTEAKNLLVSTDKTIAEIAYELGYNDNAYFSNVFKKKAGQTPSEFREEMRKLLIS